MRSWVRNWVRISFWDRVELLLPLVRRSANSGVTKGFEWYGRPTVGDMAAAVTKFLTIIAI